MLEIQASGLGRDGGQALAAVERGQSEAPLLETRNLTKSFRSLVALKNQAITIRPGEIVGVIGPNGSGKSTFFNLVSGFQRPDTGTVRFEVMPIERKPAADIVRLGISRTFQGTRLFQRLTVAENVRAAAQLRHSSGMVDALLGTPRLKRAEREVDEIMKELLDLVSLRSRAETAPASSPMATSAGSSSSARSPLGRGSSSSTSRPPGWIRARPGGS